ncbi:MAG: flavodoxin-dependent (E)-4-hydroxy-3-methylbut-2-enyl-diphosphate synthase, partial [Actinobacteria bacterium]|nr:flavodoxin-dependent (E)-4-hydroxy-3-methylbut-2-enyl-diphosphate synthase [Actinomycetota bacterium]
IAVMGCIVNGPGEAKDADIGVAYGAKKAAIFVRGKVIKRVEKNKVLEAFEKELKNVL